VDEDKFMVRAFETDDVLSEMIAENGLWQG